MKKSKTLLWIQSALCILTAALFAITAIGIYRDGMARRAEDPAAQIYSPEIVAERAAPGLVMLAASVAATVACVVMGVRDESAEKPIRDTETVRDLTASRVAEPNEAMKKERALQQKLLCGGWAAAALCMVPIVLYIANPAHFAESDAAGLEHMLAALVGHILPWTVLAFACLTVSTLLRERSMQRETAAASERAREEKAAGLAPAPKAKTAAGKGKNAARAAILALAVIFIIAGIHNGGMKDVLIKAINICTECVGLG